MESSFSYASSSYTVPLANAAAGWVQRISAIFRTEIAINIDHLPPVCVFEIPGTIRAQKPEAYSPQLIAMGPYHHLRPELYQMERYKLAAIKQISTPDQIFNFQTLVIDKLKEIDPLVRACYNKFMDYDRDALAWIVAIDGCFFLHVADSYVKSDDATDRKLLDNTILTRDVFMLENQIPFIILREIRHALDVSDSFNSAAADSQLISLMVRLCETQSPVKFSSALLNSNRFHRPLHLLDLMYHMIVNIPAYLSGPLAGQVQFVPRYKQFMRNASHNSSSNAGSSSYSSSYSSSSSSSSNDENLDLVHNNLDAILEVVDTFGNKQTKELIRPVKVVSSIPWSTVSGLFRNGNLRHEDKNPEDDEIAIPSVSHLYRYSKVQCLPFSGSINEIKFDEDEATLYLPILNLNASSEVILRNLVAYEAAMSKSTLEFARYINLMNGIVDTAEDVKMLRQNGVVSGSLKNEEIAEMFNGMKRNYVRSDRKSNIDVAIQKVNKFYDKKLIVRLARRLRRNLNASWRCLALFSTVALLILMAMQTFCQFYECSKVVHF